MLIRVTCLILCIFAPLLASAQDVQQLDQITAEQQAAEAARKTLEIQRNEAQTEINRLQKELVSSAAEAESYEQAARDIDARLAELTAEYVQLQSDVFDDRAALSDLLAALQRIERNPPPALATRPDDAKEAVQAARLLSGLSVTLKTRADQLSERLTNLDFIRQNIVNEQTALKDSEAELRSRRSALEALVREKQTLEASISEQSEQQRIRINRLAAEEDDVRDLIARLETIARIANPRIKPILDDAPDEILQVPGAIPVPRIKPRRDRPPAPLSLPPETQRFADARGQLRAPAQGTVVTKYNASIGSGQRAKGLTLQTRSEAQVIAPYAGRIEFVGPFKNYDQVVILNVGEEYFILMTGLGETYGSEGQMVLSGEPLGLMPFNVTDPPKLYIEIRKNGTPVNPTPWLGSVLN